MSAAAVIRPAGSSVVVPPHIPVLRDAAARALLEGAPANAVFVDATFGAGGHSARILRGLPADGRLLAMDWDAEAERHAAPLRADPRFHFFRRNFAELAELLREQGLSRIHGALFDLGASSMQMDSPERGFSFRGESPPDMRMDRDDPGIRPAFQWLRGAARGEVEKALRDFGEEPEARRIARALAANRKAADSARGLAECIRRAKRLPGKPGAHPATRAFQAFRIAVNRELDNLRRGLEAAHRALIEGGRLVVIAFHSLEDRAVKRFAAGETCPGIGRVTARRFVMTGKPVVPDAAEVAANPRSRSAKLRTMIKPPASSSALAAAGEGA